MLTKDELKQCHKDWQQVELADLSSNHLKEQRLILYHKWFIRLLAHEIETLQHQRSIESQWRASWGSTE